MDAVVLQIGEGSFVYEVAAICIADSKGKPKHLLALTQPGLAVAAVSGICLGDWQYLLVSVELPVEDPRRRGQAQDSARSEQQKLPAGSRWAYPGIVAIRGV
ncbi:hypothetical protein ACWF62_18920 [Rhodococcus sp. NPDC054953]